jgi:hypothetical protein
MTTGEVHCGGSGGRVVGIVTHDEVGTDETIDDGTVTILLAGTDDGTLDNGMITTVG